MAEIAPLSLSRMVMQSRTKTSFTPFLFDPSLTSHQSPPVLVLSSALSEYSISTQTHVGTPVSSYRAGKGGGSVIPPSGLALQNPMVDKR